MKLKGHDVLDVFVGESQDSSSFGDSYGSVAFTDSTKEMLLEFVESTLRIILRKLRQSMVKLSAYTCMSTGGSQSVHVTCNEEIYKNTANSIMEALSLGLRAISISTVDVLPKEVGKFDPLANSVSIDEELCTNLYCIMHSFRLFIDQSQYKKLQEKFRKRVIDSLHGQLDEYLNSKYSTYSDRMNVEGDPFVQFRMEYKVKLDKDGVLNSDISNVFVNPNPIQTRQYSNFEQIAFC